MEGVNLEAKIVLGVRHRKAVPPKKGVLWGSLSIPMGGSLFYLQLELLLLPVKLS